MVKVRNKIIAVTGSSGFIGTKLVCALDNSDNDLVLLVRNVNHKLPFKQIKCDLVSEDVPIKFLSGVDIVFHLAGCAHDTDDKNEEDYYWKINFSATVKLAKLALKNNVKKFIFISSVKAGNNIITKNCSTVVNKNTAKDIYGITKREAEIKLLDIARNSNMHISIIRPALVYGPNVKGNLGFMLSAIKKGWFPPLPKYKNARSLIHVDDLIRALLLISFDNRTNQGIYIATDGLRYSTRDIYEVMMCISNKKLPRWSVPKFFFDILAFSSPKLRGKVVKLFSNEIYSSNKLSQLGFIANKSLKDMNETIF
jgi:UDP-glucose 4-epimerase